MQVRWVRDGDRKVLQQWLEDQWQDVPEIMRNAPLSFPGGEDVYTPGRHSLKDDCRFYVGDWVISKKGIFNIIGLAASSTPVGPGPLMYRLEPLYKTGGVLFLTCSELKRDFEKYQVKKFNLREALGIEKQENVSDGKQKYIEYKSPSKGCSFEYKIDWMKNRLKIIYQHQPYLGEPRLWWVRNLELKVMDKRDRFIGDRVLHEGKAYDIVELQSKEVGIARSVHYYGLLAIDNSYKISMAAEEVMTLEVVVKSELRNYMKVLI